MRTRTISFFELDESYNRSRISLVNCIYKFSGVLAFVFAVFLCLFLFVLETAFYCFQEFPNEFCLHLSCTANPFARKRETLSARAG